MKPCKCGCGVMINEKDNWNRKHDYVVGHYTKTLTKEEFKKRAIKWTGDKHYNWKGGVYHDSRGYYINWKEGENRDKRKIPQHRLIMQQHLGRKLKSNEIVHHKNGIKDDNRIENLEIVNRSLHTTHHTRINWTKGIFNESNQHRNRDSKTGRFTSL